VAEGCGFGPCRNSLERGGAGCRLCDVIAKILPPLPCGADVAGVPCSLVRGHPWWVQHRGPRKTAAEENATRDGAPKLSGEKERGNLAFEKRRRVGPHR
jgi:hypothetical protein